MPYLHCPGCRLTVYITPSGDRPKRCSRCGAALGGPIRSLFESYRPGRVSTGRVLETLRNRRPTGSA